MTTEPTVRYTTTSDGVRIAWGEAGSGLPLVAVMGWISNIENTLATLPSFLAGCRVVTYDKRGTGLSDRGLSNYSLDANLRDLEAVIDATGLDRFVLAGTADGGPIAMSYAAVHPERVSHLQLYGTFARGQILANNVFEALLALTRADLGLASRAMADLFMPGATREEEEAFAKSLREGATAEDAAAMWEALREIDVSSLLSDIHCPTLVLHVRGDRVVPFELGRELAAAIPNARFASFDGDRHAVDATATQLGAMTSFLDEARAEYLLAEERHPPRALQTILFTDLAGSTAIQSRLGDDAAREVLRAHDAAVRQAIGEFNGREVKHTGDGIMTAFGSAADAVNCALTVRRDIATYNDTHRSEELLVRFGINAGEPIAEDDDLFGLSVTLAARIGDWGEPGQVLVSDVVRQLLLGKGFQFSSVGEAELKGFDEPVPLFEARA